VLVLEWTDPLFSAGHWVPDMVRRAGGQEVMGKTGEKSRLIGDEELAGAAPEVIVVAPCGYALADTVSEAKVLLASGRLPQAPSAWALDANRLVSSPGPGVVHGIEVLSRVMHPALFGVPAAKDALRL
jgi:iron complex transport system substrate-binding protein